MRSIRFLIVALVGAALALLPVSAGFARPAAPGVGMSATGPDDECPCCDATHGHAAMDFCSLKCCHVAAILVEAQPLTVPFTNSGADTVSLLLSPFSRQPDPPPPRV